MVQKLIIIIIQFFINIKGFYTYQPVIIIVNLVVILSDVTAQGS